MQFSLAFDHTCDLLSFLSRKLLKFSFYSGNLFYYRLTYAFNPVSFFT